MIRPAYALLLAAALLGAGCATTYYAPAAVSGPPGMTPNGYVQDHIACDQYAVQVAGSGSGDMAGGALVGGAAGAGIGAAGGALSGSPGKGAAIGGAVGILGGALAGAAQDQSARQLRYQQSYVSCMQGRGYSY